MNDELDQLVQALREEHAVEAGRDNKLARARLAKALRLPAPSRRRLGVLVLIAASFVGTVAWAQASGRLGRLFTSRAPDAATARSVRPAASTAPLAHDKGPDAMPRPDEAEAAQRSEEASVDKAPVPKPSANKDWPTKSEARLLREPPDLDVLYHFAHEAHFVKKEPALALEAWDAYLSAAGPGGRFSLEARYQRAICLVRLGRMVEAREALEPFAHGEYGEYRSDDATRLLRSLP